MTNSAVPAPVSALDAVIDARAALENGSRVSSSRRAEIVTISAGLFSERGYRGTTIRDIAERAEILSGSLYHHFESKESIIDEIMRSYWIDLFDEYERVIQGGHDSAAQIREMIGVSVRLLEQHAPAIRILLNDYQYVAEALPYVECFMSVIEQVWSDMLSAGARAGVLRGDIDPVLTYRTIMSAISGTGRWFDTSGAIAIEQVVTEMQQTFMVGIAVTGS